MKLLYILNFITHYILVNPSMRSNISNKKPQAVEARGFTLWLRSESRATVHVTFPWTNFYESAATH